MTDGASLFRWPCILLLNMALALSLSSPLSFALHILEYLHHINLNYFLSCPNEIHAVSTLQRYEMKSGNGVLIGIVSKYV